MEKNNTQQPIINRQKFNLVAETAPSWEDYGWTREFLEDMLYVEAYEPDHEWMNDHEILKTSASFSAKPSAYARTWRRPSSITPAPSTKWALPTNYTSR